nr:PREDICTED: transmembrane protein 201 [Paralichthys olivaceus]
MEAFSQIMLDYPELMYGGVGVTAFAAGGALIYKIATRKKPTHASVNCWFCDENTVVPYGNKNCWDCPSCDQYNGFQENGDYNKTIPAQHKADLNYAVSGSLHPSETLKTQQWVNCQMLLCKKCNNNQSLKIKQLASFIPRDDENYDEEIEAYKHHLEQTYKLCRPCQTAVEYYIKYQNRQLRTVLLNHQLRHSRDSVKSFEKTSYSLTSPIGVTLLRALAFLLCAFLAATCFCDFPDLPLSPSTPKTLSGGVTPLKAVNESTTKNESSGDATVLQGLLELIPNATIENAKLVWQHGRDNQLAVVSVGLLTCLMSIFLAGSPRLRRIDAVASVLWFLLLCVYLAESYLSGASSWMDMAKHSIIPVCCLVSFAAAAATRKPQGLRRGKYRRYLAGSPAVPPFSSQLPLLRPDLAENFIPTPPPNLSKLFSCQQSRRMCKDSPSSLPGRLSRALCLGTIPSFKRTDSGYLFSGSRPASQYKDSPPSDYFSLKSGSHLSSPSPSPTPSIAGSCTSSLCSARQRRPLISPARLNICTQKLWLFTTEPEPKHSPPPTSPLYSTVGSASPLYSGCFSPDTSPFQSQSDLSGRDNSVIDEEERSERCSSSGSSACVVGTTTQDPESIPPPNGLLKRLILPGLLTASLTTNLVFACLYICYYWR